MSKVIWFLLEVHKIVNKDFTTTDFHIEFMGVFTLKIFSIKSFVLFTLY